MISSMLTFPGDGVASWTQMNEWISKEMCEEFDGEELPKSTGLRQGYTVHYPQPCRAVEQGMDIRPPVWPESFSADRHGCTLGP